MILEINKILSIQSHVVSGFVGNKCCILPLQILGNDVDFINSVQFSNHTKYEFCKGQVLNSDDLRDLYDGLKLNRLSNYTNIITGYIGSKTFLEEVCNIVKDIKSSNPSALFYCDPVMGDNGKMYVPINLLDVYRTQVLPLADVLFPNQFETELLTGIEINNEEDMIKAMDSFHLKGVKIAVMTSSNLGSSEFLFGFVSKINPTDGSMQRIRMKIPKFPYDFVGTGDLFASLFLGWSLKHPDDLMAVCSKVIGSMQVVLQRTVNNFQNLKLNGKVSESRGLELRIVDSISDLMNPKAFDGMMDII